MAVKKNSVVQNLVGFKVIAMMKNGQAVNGHLLEVDKYGVLICAEAMTEDEIKERIAVAIPHESVDYIHARQDDNSHMKAFDKYKYLYEV